MCRQLQHEATRQAAISSSQPCSASIPLLISWCCFCLRSLESLCRMTIYSNRDVLSVASETNMSNCHTASGPSRLLPMCTNCQQSPILKISMLNGVPSSCKQNASKPGNIAWSHAKTVNSLNQIVDTKFYCKMLLSGNIQLTDSKIGRDALPSCLQTVT